MSSSTPERPFPKLRGVTVSDSVSRGERSDVSGPAVVELLTKRGFTVTATEISADDKTDIERAIIRLAGKASLVVTTGGTGIAERDVTPEATRSICDRRLEGVAERMRMEGSKKTPLAALSRGICGVRGKVLIVNLPGSPRGAIESLESVVEILPHAIDLLNGNTKH